MKVQQSDRKIFNIFRLCFLVLLVLSVLGTVIYSAANPQKESWESDVIYLDGLQTKDRDGNPIEVVADQRYEYDENNRLVKRTLHCTYEEWPGVKHSTFVDSIVYQDGRVSRIIETVTPDDHLWHPDILFFYDNNNRLIRTEYGYNITCYGYHNGRLDSIYSPYGNEIYTILEYDDSGNVVRERYRMSELDLAGEPTGELYFRTVEYEYDNKLRPNFNMDNAFIYEPIFQMGTTYPAHIRNLSKNNMTRFSEGPEIWEYEYNDQGLPETMYHQFGDNGPTQVGWKFKYRRVE